MLVRKVIYLFHQIDSSASRVCRNFSVYAQKCHGSHLSHLQFSLGLRYCKPYHRVRWLASDSSDSCSSSDDKLCVYQPDVRRIRIVTMNDVYTDDILPASAQTSVQRDTIYTRRHVSADDPTVQALFRGICEGSRSALARAITLIESVHPMRRAEAQVLLREVLEHSRKKRRHSLHRVNSFRIGNNTSYMTMMMVTFYLFLQGGLHRRQNQILLNCDCIIQIHNIFYVLICFAILFVIIIIHAV